jgi:hypothetical protein
VALNGHLQVAQKIGVASATPTAALSGPIIKAPALPGDTYRHRSWGKQANAAPADGQLELIGELGEYPPLLEAGTAPQLLVMRPEALPWSFEVRCITLVPQRGGYRQSKRADDCEEPDANPCDKSRGAEDEFRAYISGDPLVKQYISADNKKCENRNDKAQAHGRAARSIRR